MCKPFFCCTRPFVRNERFGLRYAGGCCFDEICQTFLPPAPNTRPPRQQRLPSPPPLDTAKGQALGRVGGRPQPHLDAPPEVRGQRPAGEALRLLCRAARQRPAAGVGGGARAGPACGRSWGGRGRRRGGTPRSSSLAETTLPLYAPGRVLRGGGSPTIDPWGPTSRIVGKMVAKKWKQNSRKICRKKIRKKIQLEENSKTEQPEENSCIRQ